MSKNIELIWIIYYNYSYKLYNIIYNKGYLNVKFNL